MPYSATPFNTASAGNANKLGAFVVLCFALVTLGCGSSGIERYRVEGEVHYNGQPIPKGWIIFSPDAVRGNKGPQTVTKIEQGRFVTPDDKGVVGGAYVVQVRGYDGVKTAGVDMIVPEGTPLFTEAEIQHELPAEDSQLRISITGSSDQPKAVIEAIP